MHVVSTRNLVPGRAPSISVVECTSARCGLILQVLGHIKDIKVLGIAFRLSKTGVVEAVALATSTIVFLVTITKNALRSDSDLACVFESPRCLLAGFSMPRLALILNRSLRSHIYGVDLSTLHSPSSYEQLSAAELADKRLSNRSRTHAIHALWLQNTDNDLCLRAWLSASIAEESIDVIQKARKVNTRHLQPHHLSSLSQLVLNVDLLHKHKPTVVNNEFEGIEIDAHGRLLLRNARFKTRVRKSSQTLIEINDGKIKAQAVSTKGKQTGLAVLYGKAQLLREVNKVRVVGREEATNAELRRDEHVLHVMQGFLAFPASPFARMLWFPSNNNSKALKNARRRAAGIASLFGRLNTSQRRVAQAMVSEGEPLVVAHGPPGTGKTSTIAAALDYWQTAGQPAWVITHSNVGVKNIARSLSEKTPKIDFKLIVSHEFYFEWHEHLYGDIEDHLIRSDDFGHGFDAKNQIGDTKIILCTLSMLSNPSLDQHGVYKHVPVERLIVDEASQIDTFEFMHLFHKFNDKLTKVCMFGDPKQLPPFGVEAAPKIKTIFDFKHLKASAYFLDTQYRMPVQLGAFISKAVYSSKLQSVHDIKDSKSVLLIDVRKGREERMGSSWKNTEEVHTILNIVRDYYLHKEFCIITPYDAQRATITDALKKAGLPHEHVYNVDSFQGHEAEYVIVSPVRTSKPGFLRSQNRVNVMLTRCKKGMVIVTQRSFLHGAGRHTLLGELAMHWESRVGAGVAWADAMRVAERRASLPGVPGRSEAHSDASKGSGLSCGDELEVWMGTLSLVQ